MGTVQAPAKAELVQRASELVPLLREKGLWMDDNRRMHDDIIDALTSADILKLEQETEGLLTEITKGVPA